MPLTHPQGPVSPAGSPHERRTDDQAGGEIVIEEAQSAGHQSPGEIEAGIASTDEECGAVSGADEGGEAGEQNRDAGPKYHRVAETHDGQRGKRCAEFDGIGGFSGGSSVQVLPVY